MSITIDLWLYGSLSRYANESSQGSHAHVALSLDCGSTFSDLLTALDMSTGERGITFVNGQLSAMPGPQHDLEHPLDDGDRVAMFDLKSMWPFQYRHGAVMTEELSEALEGSEDDDLHHTFR